MTPRPARLLIRETAETPVQASELLVVRAAHGAQRSKQRTAAGRLLRCAPCAARTANTSVDHAYVRVFAKRPQAPLRHTVRPLNNCRLRMGSRSVNAPAARSRLRQRTYISNFASRSSA